MTPDRQATVLEPQTQAFADALAQAGGPPLYQLSPQEARDVLSRAQQSPVQNAEATIEDREFPTGPTGSVRVRIVRPPDRSDVLPVIVHLHGGGWILGDRDTHEHLLRELANGAEAVVVFVDYDRSPEARYPVALEQAYAATKYVADHAQELSVDASRLALVGDSAGGQIAAVVALWAKERGGPAIAFQALFYPVTDANFHTGSYIAFADGPWLTEASMEWFWNAYLPDPEARKDPSVTPLNAELDQLRGLPPTLVITAENDVLRDEGEAYARKLSQAGVDVTSTRYNGTIHDFVMLHALANTPAARAAIHQASEALRAALHPTAH